MKVRNLISLSIVLSLCLTLASCDKNAKVEVIESVNSTVLETTSEITTVSTEETVAETSSIEATEIDAAETEEIAESTTTSNTTTTTVTTNQTTAATNQVVVSETTQARSYSCEMCGSSFTSNSQLNNHLEVVHGYGAPEATTATVTPCPTATPTPSPTPTVAPKPVRGKADVEYDIDVWHDDVYGYDDNGNWVIVTPGYTERITVTFSNVSVSFSGPYNDPYVNSAGGNDVSNRIDSKYNWRWYSNGTILRTYDIVYE